MRPDLRGLEAPEGTVAVHNPRTGETGRVVALGGGGRFRCFLYVRWAGGPVVPAFASEVEPGSRLLLLAEEAASRIMRLLS